MSGYRCKPCGGQEWPLPVQQHSIYHVLPIRLTEGEIREHAYHDANGRPLCGPCRTNGCPYLSLQGVDACPLHATAQERAEHKPWTDVSRWTPGELTEAYGK